MGGSGAPKCPFFGGQRGPNSPPPDVKYNVQPCSTNVQPIWGCWDCLWPNMSIFGQKRSFLGGSGAPKCHFLGAKRVQTHPPGCEIQCSTMFNQCSTHLGFPGLPMANYGHFGPKKAVLGSSGAPIDIFSGPIGSQLTPCSVF